MRSLWNLMICPVIIFSSILLLYIPMKLLFIIAMSILLFPEKIKTSFIILFNSNIATQNIKTMGLTRQL